MITFSDQYDFEKLVCLISDRVLSRSKNVCCPPTNALSNAGIFVGDTNSIHLEGNGKSTSPILGTLKLSAAVGNIAVINSDGLYVPTGGAGYTDEEAQDAVGSIFDITEFTYNDAAPSITINQIDWAKIINTPAFGTVNSVDATIPAGAINIAGGPITNSGILAFTYTGTVNDYIRGDGSLAVFPGVTIPTLQQVLTSGSILTSNHTISGGGFDLSVTNSNIFLESPSGNQIDLEDPVGGVEIRSVVAHVGIEALTDLNLIAADITATNLGIDNGGYLKVGVNALDLTSPINGEIYYNSITNKFRAYENGVWVDMISGGGIDINFADDDLVLSGNRSHQFNNFSWDFTGNGNASILSYNGSGPTTLFATGLNGSAFDHSDGAGNSFIIRTLANVAQLRMQQNSNGNAGATAQSDGTNPSVNLYAFSDDSFTYHNLRNSRDGIFLTGAASSISGLNLYLQDLPNATTANVLYIDGSGQISYGAAPGGGGGNTLYIADDSLAGDRIVNLNSNSLDFQQVGHSFLRIDPTSGAEVVNLFAKNLTGLDNNASFEGNTTNTLALTRILTQFNGNSGPFSLIVATADASASQIQYDSDEHRFLGNVELATIPNAAGTHELRYDNVTGQVSYEVISSGGSGTVNAGAINTLAYYVGAGTTVDDLTAITANRALISDANGLPIASSVTNTTLAFLDATSSVQTQLDDKVNKSTNQTGIAGTKAWTNHHTFGAASAGSVITIDKLGVASADLITFKNSGTTVGIIERHSSGGLQISSGGGAFHLSTTSSGGMNYTSSHASGFHVFSVGGATRATLNTTGFTLVGTVPLKLNGSTSGQVTIAASAIAGTTTLTLPTAYAAVDGYLLSSTTAGILSWVAPSGGASTFLALTDTPSSFTGEAGKAVRVNTGETALEFYTLFSDAVQTSSSSSYTWNVALGENLTWTITGTTNTIAFSNTVAGRYYNAKLVQGDGNDTVSSWPAGTVWFGGVAPTLSTGAGDIDFVVFYFDGTTYYAQHNPLNGVTGANSALSNLASVAINTSLISDADNTDDLGSAANGWKDVYLRTAKFDGSTSGTTTLEATAIAGTTTITLPATTGTVALVADLPTSGEYTPTLTNIANVASSTAGLAYWTRIGAYVTVYGTVQVQGTLASTVTSVDMSLPVASAFTAVTDLTGIGQAVFAAAESTITANTTNDRAALTFFNGSGTPTHTIQYNYRYKVI